MDDNDQIIDHRPLFEKIISSKVAWIFVFVILAAISFFIETYLPARAVGIVSILGLIFTYSEESLNDRKGWAIIFLVGVILGLELGGLSFFS